MQADADAPHGAAADWAAAAIAGLNTAHPAAMVTDITAWRKKRITETPSVTEDKLTAAMQSVRSVLFTSYA